MLAIRVRALVAASLAFATIASASSSVAQARPSRAEMDERIQLLSTALDREALPSARWRWGWSIVLGSLAVGNATRAIIGHALGSNDTTAGWVGCAGSTLGLLNMLVIAPTGQYAATEFRRALAFTSDRYAQLREGERLLRAVAKNQDFTVGPASQAMRIMVPVMMGLLLEYGFGLHIGAILNVAGGTVLGQVTIRTAPTAAIDAWQRYATRYPDALGGAFTRSSRPFATVAIAANSQGIVVVGAF